MLPAGSLKIGYTTDGVLIPTSKLRLRAARKNQQTVALQTLHLVAFWSFWDHGCEPLFACGVERLLAKV